jgi:hypothetical protein
MADIESATTINWMQVVEQASAPATPASGFGRYYTTTTGKPAHVNDAGTPQILYTNPEIFIRAISMIPTLTAGSAPLATSETTTNDVNYQSLDFDQTTQEHANFTIVMPDDWNAGTVTFKAYWTAAAGAGTVVWGLQGISFADDDALDTAFGTAQTSTDTLLATGDMHISPVSSAITIAGTPAVGEPVVFRIYRDTATDTLTGDAKLIGLKLYYTRA